MEARSKDARVERKRMGADVVIEPDIGWKQREVTGGEVCHEAAVRSWVPAERSQVAAVDG